MASFTDIVNLNMGVNHSMAMKSDGTLFAWGLNHKGQVGNNSTSDVHGPVSVLSLGG